MAEDEVYRLMLRDDVSLWHEHDDYLPE